MRGWKMSGLRNAWEISLEKTDKSDPDSKKRKALTDDQKKAIAEIRKEYKAKLADIDISLQFKLGKLPDRNPPEEVEVLTIKLKDEYVLEKQAIENEMESKIEAIRQ
jgi:hypothetical protein